MNYERTMYHNAEEETTLGLIKKLDKDLKYMPIHSVDSEGECSCGAEWCPSPGAHPILEEKAYYPSNRLDDLCRWFVHQPKNNVAIATGRESGLMAISIRVGCFFVGANFGPLVRPTVIIGSRYYIQLVFQYPEDCLVPTVALNTDYPEVCIHGEGGYIIIPPSHIGSRMSGDSVIVEEVTSNVEVEKIRTEAAPCPDEIKRIVKRNSADGFTLQYNPRQDSRKKFLQHIQRLVFHLKDNLKDFKDAISLCDERVAFFNQPLPLWEFCRLADAYPGPKEKLPNVYQAFTEIRIAKVLSEIVSDDMKYCVEEGKVRFFDADKWSVDEEGGCSYQRYVEMLNILKHTVIEQIHDGKEQKRKLSWLLRYESQLKFRYVSELFKTDVRNQISINDMDQDPALINFTNCTLDLRTSIAYPNFRFDYITHTTGYEYDPDATCENFIKFLESSIRDEPRIRFLQKYLAYCTTGDVSLHAILFFVGDGANGKSTLLEVLKFVLGSYCCVTPVDTFLSKRRNAVPSDVARLRGKRLVLASEMGTNHKLSVDRVKILTGADTIVARYLYQEWFEFIPTHKFIISTNHLPLVDDFDEALIRRLYILKFDHVIPKEQQVRNLPSILKKEAAGIMNWILDGHKLLREEGLEATDSMRKELYQYRSDQDVILRFIDEWCNEDWSADVSLSHLYDVFQIYLKKQNERRKVSKKAFSIKLVESKYLKSRRSEGTYFDGIAVKEEIGRKIKNGLSL